MKNETFVALLALCAVIGTVLYVNSPPEDPSLHTEFENWKMTHNVGSEYSNAENIYRMNIFRANLNEINEHNSLLGRSYDMGLNILSDMTKEEFSVNFLAEYAPNQDFNQLEVESDLEEENGQTVDWIKYGAVSPVKYQGNCLASYAFSGVGAIEGVSVIYFKNQQEYSVQQVVDCSYSYGNNGCVNGRMDNTFNYVRNVGINTMSSYPYTAVAGQCRTSSWVLQSQWFGASGQLQCISQRFDCSTYLCRG